MVEQRSRRVFLFISIFSLLLNFTAEQQELLSSSVEKLALLQLRSSLDIRSTHWPIKLEPCLFWEGIQCNNGHVVGINISSFKRARAGSRKAQFSVYALQNFTLLTYFNASGFALPGSIPEWFGLRFASLQVLDLSSCSIVDSIPSSIGNLSSLISLYLSSNDLSGLIPASLSQLISLEVLDISNNSLSGIIPDAFTYLRNLTSLDMSFNNLSGIIPHGIGALSILEYLNLSGNSLFSSIPAQIGDLSNLVYLDLGFNSLSGPVPLDLRELRNLQRLLIGNNMLSGPLPLNLFAHSSPLQFVVLSHNAFTGPLPDVLWSLTQLKYFDASGNNMTAVLPMFNTTAAVFNLSWNLFYGSLDPIIQGVGFIDLSGNYFEGKLPNDAQRKMSAAQNCFENASEQRSLSECTLFYSDRGFLFQKIALVQPGLLPTSEKKSHRTLVILVTVLGSAGVILTVVILLFLVIVCTHKRRAINQKGIGIDQGPAGVSLKISYQLISKATDGFKDKNLVKKGHSGDFFHGTLEGGIPVVIKRVDLRLVKKETHITELNFLSKVSHTRFVPLLGYCLEDENQKFLVYKYMPNADLSASLYKKIITDNDSLQSLDWITRLKIAIGAAEGLSYLHHECSPPFVHRSVQASSILLDDGFEVCLGSLSEACIHEEDNRYSRITSLLHLHQTTERGSSGTKTSTCAYDVYCFGKVLLELVTGKLGISASSDATMKDLLEQILPYISLYDKDLVTNILDPSLIVDEDLLEEVWAMAIVARSCLNPIPSRRPLMKHILKVLENPLKLVREEYHSSTRLRATSSRSLRNAALIGSWRCSSLDTAAVSAVPVNKTEGGRRTADGVPLKVSYPGDEYNYKLIFKAAGEFKDENLAKKGHSGDIFRGTLEGGIPVVIKRVDLRLVKKETYMTELNFISKVSHTRFLPLLGYCLENENEKFLVYKYMPNADLSASLYRKVTTDDDSLQSLDWITRLKIAIGVAEGLSYLHHECTPPFVHSEACVHEGDKHHSRITRLLDLPQTSEHDSSGTQTSTCAYDVYCFGLVLLELVTGKLDISARSDATVKGWLEQTLSYISICDKDLVTNILDPSLIIDEDLLEEAWAMAIVAKSCLNPRPSKRPVMKYILKALENPLILVREEYNSSARLRTISSRSSWNAALFGSWRSSSLDAAALNEENV